MKPLAAATLIAVALAQPLAAAETGASAFDRRDFATAATLWRAEAAAGSAEAKLGLGLLSDLGLGTPRDAARAFRWYLEAASDGLPEAEFNVGVMMDAGAGVPADPVAAAVWYARAAANGHSRGEYNLGLLYETGDGVPRNPDLARFWLKQAASALPAAAERYAALAPAAAADRRLAPPDLGTAALVSTGDARRVELVWSASPGPEDAHYLVELARLPEPGATWGSFLLAQPTQGSAAIATPLPDTAARYAWRVSAVDPAAARYAASPWQVVGDAAAAGLPAGRVTLHVGAGDTPAHWLAGELAASFADAGLWVRIEEDPVAPARIGVGYGFTTDAGLARSIAAFLPALTADDAKLAPGLPLAPGEIEVRISGGPSHPKTLEPEAPRTAQSGP